MGEQAQIDTPPFVATYILLLVTNTPLEVLFPNPFEIVLLEKDVPLFLDMLKPEYVAAYTVLPIA